MLCLSWKLSDFNTASYVFITVACSAIVLRVSAGIWAWHCVGTQQCRCNGGIHPNPYGDDGFDWMKPLIKTLGMSRQLPKTSVFPEIFVRNLGLGCVTKCCSFVTNILVNSYSSSWEHFLYLCSVFCFILFVCFCSRVDSVLLQLYFVSTTGTIIPDWFTRI